MYFAHCLWQEQVRRWKEKEEEFEKEEKKKPKKPRKPGNKVFDRLKKFNCEKSLHLLFEIKVISSILYVKLEKELWLTLQNNNLNYLTSSVY